MEMKRKKKIKATRCRLGAPSPGSLPPPRGTISLAEAARRAHRLNGTWKYATLSKGGRLFIIDSAKNVHVVRQTYADTRPLFPFSLALPLSLRRSANSNVDRICRYTSHRTADINYAKVNSCSESTECIPHIAISDRTPNSELFNERERSVRGAHRYGIRSFLITEE